MLMLSADQKKTLHAAFEARKPGEDDPVDAYLDFDSASGFALSQDGIRFRLALTSNEVLELGSNAVCAGRLAATLLDLIARSGEFTVDLRIWDGQSGELVARVTP